MGWMIADIDHAVRISCSRLDRQIQSRLPLSPGVDGAGKNRDSVGDLDIDVITFVE